VNQREAVSYMRLQWAGDVDEASAQLETLWTQLRRGRVHQPQYNQPVVRPAVDVYRTPEAVVVVVEIPGMTGRQVGLEIDGDRLTIWGEKGSRACGEQVAFSQMEIASGVFRRSVELPAEIDPDRVEFRYEGGYLEIRLARAQRPIGRTVRLTLRQS
jgi:HSP20 family protein